MATVPANYRPLEGSLKRAAADARLLGPADAAERLSVTARVRRRPDAPPLPDHAHWMATPPGRRKYLTHEEFANQYGAAQQDLDAVSNFAQRQGLTVEETSLAARTVVLSGTVEQMSAAFAVELGRYEFSAGIYRGHDGLIHIPNELADIVLAVFGLDNRRLGFRNGGDPPNLPATLSPILIAQFYNFPQGPPDASGQRIGVLEAQFGGGYSPTDITDTLQSWGAPASNPAIVSVPSNGNSANSDDETILDVCTASAVAPGATIQVYWVGGSQSDQDWFNAIDRIFHNPKAGDPLHPNVLSISWTLIGGDDYITPGTDGVSAALVNEISSDFKDMTAAGITVLAASGDGGSLGWNTTNSLPPGAIGKAHVAYPASDPWVTSCGGTSTGVTSSFALGQEWLWNDDTGATGGGISAFFPTLPPWQVGVVSQLSIPGGAIGRGVPDVAGNASLNSGYYISVGSTSSVRKFPGPYCGTSAVAPLYAGLVAMINARLGQNQYVGFLNPTLYALRNTVCLDINDQLFPGAPLNNSFSGSPGYPSGPGWDACTGLGRIDGGALLGAIQAQFLQDCQFILDRTEIGQAEVNETLTTSAPGVIANAFYVIVDGFSASALGVTSADLTGTPALAPTFSVTAPIAGFSGMQVVATSLLPEDTSLPTTPQRFTWVCEARFDTSLSAFNSVPVELTLTASISNVSHTATVSANATIELVAEADPYELDGPVSWLSTDLRVFRMTTKGSLEGLPLVTLNETGTSGNPQIDAPAFIQAVIAGFNQNTAPPPNHPFDNISIDEQVSEVTLDPTDSTTGLPIYNFAVARVRYQSKVPSQKVRVFFRLYRALTTSTAYELQTYAAVSNSSVSTSGKIPVFGVDSAGDIVAIPCFASKRVSVGTDLTQQTDDSNVILKGILPAADGGVTYTYFGCWLDINQSTVNFIPNSPLSPDSATPWSNGSQSVMTAIRGQHQCLIAEISYDVDPVLNGETPASSDKLAQRNLAIVASSNPGNPASHRIPHTLDIRPTPVALPAGAKVDELMIQWGNTPAGNPATIYLPGVSAAQVLALAAQMYVTHKFSRLDDHTLQCQTGGVTWIPVPQSAGPNFAGLLTVDLPPTVRKGQVYTIVARQVTSLTATRPLPDKPQGLQASHSGAVTPSIPERRVLGAVQLTIPVKTEEALLEPEERLLGIMRWIGEGISAGDRWSPVFERYIAQIADRVEGFGGDPAKMLPSPAGSIPHPPKHGGKRHEHAFTGKVSGLVYDRFGDFDGFLVRTHDGGEHSFRSREQHIETLVHRAWLERIVITVFVHRDDPRWPASIILRQPPRHIEHCG